MDGGPPSITSRLLAGIALFLACSASVLPLVARDPEYRPVDDRPELPEARLKMVAIERYESPRLRLYSDIAADLAQPLPPLADQLYAALEKTFGPLPPDPKGKEFQVTAYLMKDKQKFLENGLINEQIRSFEIGQHLGYQFWMFEQEYDYYRRHLLLHEYTHCFMLATKPAVRDRPGLWYLEGMAEVFGTHRLDPQGKLTFGVMPASAKETTGLGRIEMIQHAIARGDFLTVADVQALGAAAFTKSRSDPYAWSWALCQFLGTHPRYAERFRKLHQHVTDGEFDSTFRDEFGPDADRWRWEWEWFITDLVYGSDIARGAIEFAEGKPLEKPKTLSVDPARSWQSTGIHFAAHDRFTVSATGRVTVNKTSKPWVCEPQGITFEYEAGHPLGQLLGWILPDAPDRVAHDLRVAVLPLGRGGTFEVPRAGTLYLRVNDHANDRANNAGRFDVTISPGRDQGGASK